MFHTLTESFGSLFKRLTGNATISEKNVADAMRDVRTSLLEADVALEVVDRFCERVTQDAVGREVTKSLRPGEEMVGIVYHRLVEVLGGDPNDTSPPIGGPSPVGRAAKGPTVVMMCGLQGSGKTTTCGKLAGYLAKRGRSVMLAACDLQRPAAVDQLETLVSQLAAAKEAGSASVEFYGEKDKVAAYGQAVGIAVDVARRAYAEASRRGVDVLVLDTAGRLHVNAALMDELGGVKKAVPPHHVFLVVDSMTGQDAVRSSRAFHDALGVGGVILTKFDSDTRGGAALSVREVTGAGIVFVGTGEKLDALEEFHAKRFAGRILGMGDVLSLVEKAQDQVSEDEAQSLQEKMARGEMSMDDFLKQLKTLRRMGPMKQLLGLLPGMGSLLKDVSIEDKQLDRVEAMISSMTRSERATPRIIDIPRRRRIASGSGTKPEDVAQLVRQFDMVGKMTRQMATLSSADRVKAARELGGGTASGFGGLRSKGSSATPSIKSKFKKRK